MRRVEIPLERLLDLIIAADDYGYGKDALMSFLALAVHPLTIEEVQEFADSYLSEAKRAQGYGEEDTARVQRDLLQFRLKWREYCERNSSV